MAQVIYLNDYALTEPHSSIFARMRQAFAKYREYVATVEELSAHGDRDLADLGLSRLDVRNFAHKAVYGS